MDYNLILMSIVTQIAVWIPHVVSGLITLGAFIIAANVARRVIQRLCKTAKLHEQVVQLASQCAYVSLVVFGIIGSLGTVGVDVSAMVAGLGLTGFAVGFATKDTISNVLSGILLLIYRPFHIGDRITVGTYCGNVVAMDLRYTSLVGQDQLILVPNSFMFTQPIVLHVKTNVEHR